MVISNCLGEENDYFRVFYKSGVWNEGKIRGLKCHLEIRTLKLFFCLFLFLEKKKMGTFEKASGTSGEVVVFRGLMR